MIELLEFLCFLYWIFKPAVQAIAVTLLFAVIVWLMMNREVPYWWTLPGIAAGMTIAHFALPPDGELFVLSPLVIGAALGGLLADTLWLLLRKTGHAG